MSGRRSRNKGATGEREWASFLRDQGWEAHRGRQYHGGPDSPDVKCSMPGVSWEVKRVERLRLYEALDQARDEAPEGRVPAVAHRRNRHRWVVVLDAEDFCQIMREVDCED